MQVGNLVIELSLPLLYLLLYLLPYLLLYLLPHLLASYYFTSNVAQIRSLGLRLVPISIIKLSPPLQYSVTYSRVPS